MGKRSANVYCPRRGNRQTSACRVFQFRSPPPIRISPSCFASLASQRLFSLWKQSASGDISPGCLIFSSSSFLLFHFLRGSSLSFPRLSSRVFEKLYLHRREAREYREILASPLGGRIHSSEGEAMAWSCRWPSNTVAQYPIIKLAGCYIALLPIPSTIINPCYSSRGRTCKRSHRLITPPEPMTVPISRGDASGRHFWVFQRRRNFSTERFLSLTLSRAFKGRVRIVREFRSEEYDRNFWPINPSRDSRVLLAC